MAPAWLLATSLLPLGLAGLGGVCWASNLGAWLQRGQRRNSGPPWSPLPGSGEASPQFRTVSFTGQTSRGVVMMATALSTPLFP